MVSGYATISIIYLMIVYLLSKMISKGKYSALHIFCIWWGIAISMSLIPVWGRSIASEEIYFSILVSIVCFTIGAVLSNYTKIKDNSFCNEVSYISKYFSKRLFAVINIVAALLIIVLFVKSFSVYGLSMFSSIGVARSEIYTGEAILSSAFEKYLDSYLLRPCLYTDVIFSPMILENVKDNKRLAVFILINLLVYTFIYGGRMFVFYMAVIVFVGERILKDLKGEKQTFYIEGGIIRRRKGKRNHITTIIIALLVVIVIVLSFSRNNSGQENNFLYLIEKSMTYFSTSPIYYNSLQDMTSHAEQAGYQFTLIGGVFGFLAHINGIIGLNLVPDVVGNVTKYMTAHLVNVGGNVWTNAFPTMVYTFRFDFGYFGIVFNSFLFGFIAQRIYKKMKIKGSVRHFLLYMVMLYFVIESPMRWTGLQFWPLFVVSFILFITRHNKDLRRNKRWK